MRYTIKPRPDDVDKIRADTAHDVVVGGNARVSIGALQLATLTAKRQRSEATPLRHAVKARTR